MKNSGVLLLLAFPLLAGVRATAGTDLTLAPSPNAANLVGGVPGMDVTFNAATHSFVASGWTSDFYYNQSDSSFVDTGTYTLTATITSAGVLTGGSLTIDGAVTGSPDPTTLLTASLVTGNAGTAFGYGDDNNDVFQFLFDVTGGNSTVVSDFGGSGAEGGVILTSFFGSTPDDTPFTGSWAGSFNNNDGVIGDGNGTADAFALAQAPEPAPSLLLIAGGVICGAAFRFRQRHSSTNPA